ncbi:MAG: prepilin peptidase [Agathobacter sp.]|nr:prepilin peptidase [Agathobacter sp.]
MDVIEVASLLTLHLLVLAAMLQDIKETRISNRLILSGILISIALRILHGEVRQIYRILPNIIIPVVMLYLFYLMGAIGAGDIKLFSLIGSFVNLRELISCIVFSFIVGAALSLVKLLVTKQFFVRISDGWCYILDLIRGNWTSYSHRDTGNVIHFAVPIMAGLLLSEAYGLWWR